MSALLVLITGAIGIASVLAVRWRAGRRWATGLEAFKLHIPAGLSVDDISRWLGIVAVLASTSARFRRPPLVIGIEVRATGADGIEHFALVPGFAEERLLQTLRAGLPGARIEPAPDYLDAGAAVNGAHELRLTTTRRPLAVERGEAVATSLLTSLLPLAPGETVQVSWLLAGAGTPQPPHRSQPASARHSPIWPNPGVPRDADAQQAKKDSELQLLASLRVGATAVNRKRAAVLVNRTTATLRGLNAPGVRLVRSLVPSKMNASRMRRRALPLRNWQLFNTKELASIIGVPVGNAFIPGLRMQSARQLPPSPGASRRGVVLARSTYPGSDQLIRMGPDARLRHLWLLGPTGVGKSTLIANMALQDAAAGRGFVVVDPKSDLVTDILARLPESRHDDVLVLDPSSVYADDARVVGVNVLGQARTEQERELATDQIVYILHSLWADSWGPRTSDVLRNAILTLTHARAADGTAFALVDVIDLLENLRFRRFVTSQPSVPDVVHGFWADYDSYSDAQRLQIIGPSLNKLRALTTRAPLRLMLGQSGGIEVAEVLRSNKILLVPLSKGVIGPESAQLLGSLIVAQIVGAIFGRAATPVTERHPVTIYLDEFHEVLRLANDLPDAFAQARGLGAGFVLANQYMHQLPDLAKRAVMGTVRSAIVFGLQDFDDAKALERRFAPLTAAEIMHIPAFEIAAQLADGDASSWPVTGLTLPLLESTSDPAALARRSGARYGTARTEIEEAMAARLTPRPSSGAEQTKTTGFGRRKLGGTE